MQSDLLLQVLSWAIVLLPIFLAVAIVHVHPERDCEKKQCRLAKKRAQRRAVAKTSSAKNAPHNFAQNSPVNISEEVLVPSFLE